MKTVKVNMPKGSSHKIVQISDIHVGAMNCRLDLLEKIVKQISKEKNTRVLLCGDLADGIGHKDPRFNPSEIDSKNFSIRNLGDIFRKQSIMVADMLKPIKKQIVGAVIGNHETAPARHNQFNIYDYYCDLLELPDCYRLGDVGIVRFAFHFGGNDIICRNWAIKHGSGTRGGTPGHALNNVVKNFVALDCDIHSMGHMHGAISKKFRYKSLNSHCNVVEKFKHYGASGCYLDSLIEGSSCYGDGLGGDLPDLANLVFTIKKVAQNKFQEKLDVEELL